MATDVVERKVGCHSRVGGRLRTTEEVRRFLVVKVGEVLPDVDCRVCLPDALEPPGMAVRVVDPVLFSLTVDISNGVVDGSILAHNNVNVIDSPLVDGAREGLGNCTVDARDGVERLNSSFVITEDVNFALSPNAAPFFHLLYRLLVMGSCRLTLREILLRIILGFLLQIWMWL
ncbi:hypothetical protein MA16_Dca007294 [Dendrobium catenatum]|uniref:Uncharacterized protein n=1 Tax=Dendrobium catenatum TaxID=906689 RepID=A0A2I0W6L0_9ASPA|nr:hypothetical protein MA16_Dca007294 [Dendrobium catenatum]